MLKSIMFVFGAAGAANAICASPLMSTKGADTILLRKYGNGLSESGAPFTNYEHGLVWRTLALVNGASQNTSYTDYIKASADNIVTAEGNLLDYNLTYYTLDDVRVGESLITLHNTTGEAKYEKAATLLRDQLQSNPRNPEGGFWHRSTYPNQMWLDGLYMVSPFYTQYTSVYQPTNISAYDDVILQFTLTHTNCQNSNPGQTGLLKHGYDSSRVAVWADEATGASPEVWSRALGWYVMALVDVLDDLPVSHSGVATLKTILAETIAAIKKAADPETKMWWLIMGRPGQEGNYIESSGTAMFVYAMLKGIRMGYLDKAEYFETAIAGYNGLLETFVFTNATDGGLDFEGTVSVGSLSGKGDFAYYISVPLRQNDLKGFAPFVLASLEYEAVSC